MGVHEQFYARHQRMLPFRGSGIGSFLKGAAKKGWHFIKSEGKKAGSSLLDSAKDYVGNELKSSGKQFIDQTGNKLRRGVTDIVKDSAGSLADSILKNPGATSEIVKDHYKHASNKTKNLIKEAADDSRNFARGQADEIKSRSNVALSEALSKTKLKGKGAKKSLQQTDGEASKLPSNAEVAPHRRKRLTTIVPVAMPAQMGNGAQLIGSQHRGKGARLIGGN